jgi:outer membrane protein assembly factor BamB
MGVTGAAVAGTWAPRTAWGAAAGVKVDKPTLGRGPKDEPEEAVGGPLALGPWAHGKSSTSTATMLMFRGNGAHTFYGTGPLPEQAPRILWQHRMIDFPSLYYGEPHVWSGTGWTGQAAKLGDYVFIGSQGCHLYAFEAASGKLRWRFHGDRMFKASVCLYENRVYIGNVDNFLRCLDAATGKVIWKLNTMKDLDSSACVVDDRLYIAGENGHARCLDPRTGTQIWKTFVGAINRGPKGGSYGSETSPAVANGEYYCATYDGELFRIDAATGEIVWKAITGDDTDASPVIWGDFVYAAAQEKSPFVHCFERATGKLVWKKQSKGGFWASPALSGGKLFIGSAGGEILALDATSGALVWRVDLGHPTWSSASVVDEKLVIAGFDGVLRCLDAKTGKPVWEKKLGGRMHSTPCIVDGKIYIGTRQGFFYAIGA